LKADKTCSTCTGSNILKCTDSNVALNPTSGGCKDGFGGADCNTVCIVGGKTCSTTTLALSCLSGYYNNNAAS